MVKKYNFSASDLIIYSSLFLGVFLVIWPLMNLLAWALTPTQNVHLLDGLDIFPKGFDFDVFKLMLSNPRVLISFTNSILITTVGLCLNMFFTSIAAYALSKDYLPGRNLFLSKGDIGASKPELFLSEAHVGRY